jgi:hypothetical protein
MVLLALYASPLRAQEPAPPDTLRVPQDTAVVRIPPEQVAQDTLPTPEATPVDTLRPAPNLPIFPRAPATGFAQAVWEWDRAELDRWHGMSLLTLLEEVPGLLVTRAGWYGRPAGVAAFGGGGGRLRVFVDGFELDPLEAAVFDVQHVAVVDLEAVRVERTLAETRIHLLTFRQPDQRAYSQVEAGTALFRTRILRGLFSTQVGTRNVVSVGLDITDTQGWLGLQPFAANGVLARWTHSLGQRSALQLEYRQTGIESAGAPFGFQGDRRDLIFRARTNPAPGLAVDALAGRSWRRPGDADTLQVDLESIQGALRARYDFGAAWLGAAARMRAGDRPGFAIPTLDIAAEAGLRPLPWLLASGEVRNTRTDGIGGTELQGGVRVGPFGGLSLFANAASGGRGIGVFRDTVFAVTEPDPTTGQPVQRQDTVFLFPAVESQLTAFRAGAEWNGWGVRLGAAYVSHDLDRMAPFGLAFDRTAPVAPGGLASGFEGYVSVPLLYRPLRFEGSFTRWNEIAGRPYLPLDQLRGGLVFNERFYGGNLEPTLRVEAVHRGSAFVPTPDRATFGAVSAPYTLFNIFLQIRVLDVRAFLIWDNLLNEAAAADLVGPGRFLGGQRAIYGVRWHFFD